jgi:myo-inositol-1-phosphate synthase
VAAPARQAAAAPPKVLVLDVETQRSAEEVGGWEHRERMGMAVAVTHDLAADNVHVGPSDFVPWLEDRKWAHIRLEGRGFGDQPINVELKLEVWDSPNSAGVVIDAIRCCRVALDRGLKGALLAPSAYLMKSPPEQWPDGTARDRLERFIAGEE